LPAPLFLSSGDLVADRRYDFGRDLELRGDFAAAAELMEQAIELAPRFASAWFALGELRQKLNLHGEAIKAYRRAVEADPEDRHGASLRLMRLGAETLTTMPQAYVRTLFDQYAPSFDKALVESLNYRGPQILLKAVLSTCVAQKRPARFAHALDLGCGTGLGAHAFASIAGEFVGIDLSPGMIARARATGLYARLEVADMTVGLRKESDATFDLVIAADALVYVPDLAAVLNETARVLRPRGFVALTVETHRGEGVILGEKLRYAHSEKALREVVANTGLTLRDLFPASTRDDGGEPVAGLVAVAEKP
jgi:predicted TPR repeat methyltransferase